MFKRIIGRTGKGNRPIPSAEEYVNSDEYARNQAIFDQLNAEIRERRAALAANPEPFDPVRAERWRQRGDIMGTEGFPDHLYDGAGNIVYTRRGFDGWYDNDGIRRFDLSMRPVDSPGAQ
ncbi:hypothetical protein [Nocardia brevicatena]|uniref:hypothetical protein n=1 Tax=Nocardia brevicatena TaxID=37327 RepID=UPI00030CE91E|nr:hypothetical protein [Nocardia brevicatena]